MIKSLIALAAALFMVIPSSHAAKPIRYVALGDSYTAGTGATPETAWPAVVTRRLQQKGVAIELTANLGRNGWTARDVIEGELPALAALRPDVVTLLIGTNDWVQGINETAYRADVHAILAQLKDIVKRPDGVLVITSPDFSAMPNGPLYANGRDIPGGLARLNAILMEEAKSFGFRTFDIFLPSQSWAKEAGYPSSDGLHPSAQGYARWADAILPEFHSIE